MSKVESAGGERPNAGSRWLIAAAIAPVLVSLAVLFSQWNPYPYEDDYHAIVDFAVTLSPLHGLWAKALYIVTAQHNEYKLIFEHCVVAAELELTHRLSFSFLTGLGNLLIVGLGYVLWLGIPARGKRLERRLREFLPAALVMLALGYWENLDWAMTGLQNVAVVLFSLLTMYFLTLDEGPRVLSRPMVLGCMFALIAASASVNGFLLAPAGALFLLSRKAWLRLAAWGGTFALALAVYLYAYHSPAHALHPAAALMLFLEVAGWAVPVRYASAAVGLAIVAIAVMAARSRFDRVHPFAAYSAVWALMTAGLVALGRAKGDDAISARYSLYSLLLVVCCLAFLRERWRAEFERMERAVIVGCVLYFLLVDARAWRSLRIRKGIIVGGIRQYEADPKVNSPMIDPTMLRLNPKERPYELMEMNAAVAAGIYRPEWK